MLVLKLLLHVVPSLHKLAELCFPGQDLLSLPSLKPFGEASHLKTLLLHKFLFQSSKFQFPLRLKFLNLFGFHLVRLQLSRALPPPHWSFAFSLLLRLAQAALISLQTPRMIMKFM